MERKKERTYIAIDLKSFYASVECVERGLDPLTTNLVVADKSRTEKTICLAVSPSLKSYGISGRARLFEVMEAVKEINAKRRSLAPGKKLEGSSFCDPDLKADPKLALDYITAVPRMGLYMEYSTRVVSVYLKYVSAEDLHIYSIDEVFMDVTDYLNTYGLTPRELAMKMILEVLENTGITATAGIGTNMYLAKIAMDIEAKHIPPDKNGVRLAELDERSYREKLWDHEPLTDFWRVGRGIAGRLAKHGIRTMGDIALCSVGGPEQLHNEDLLYRLFGVNAELLIDHAWGWEPCTIKEIKSYRPQSSSLSSGQVLHVPYPNKDARLVVWEMADMLALDLVAKGVDTDQMVLSIGYDRSNLEDPLTRKLYKGPVERDWYGRNVPKGAHGSVNLPFRTNSGSVICDAVMELFDRITDPLLTVRRMYVVANRVQPEGAEERKVAEEGEQLDLFNDYSAREKQLEEKKAGLEDEKRLQKALLEIRGRYGKNAILKGANMLEGATARDRNSQIGGHRK
ncbi:MAG: DNA methylase [Firmicutes bacterium]|nr:DNA methylase [Bacillota bacterium]